MATAKKITILIPVLLLVFYGFFLTHKTNLITADLGRHLKNGQEFFQNFSVNETNLYSYTQPDYPTINHHWASGAVFYLAYKYFGFSGLSIFFIILSLLTFLIFFRVAYRRVGMGVAGLVALPAIGLMASRIEIRPETFSYLFAGIFLLVLWGFRDGIISYRQLLVLPVLQIFWVNLHIYFFLGPLLIGVFLLRSLIVENLRDQSRKLFNILSFTALACLVNPAGLAGALVPFNIFRDYGYALYENQTVWFIENFLGQPSFYILKAVTALLAISFLLVLFKKKNFAMINFMVGIIFVGMAWLAVRNIALLGFFALPILSTNIGRAFENEIKEHSLAIDLSALAAIVIVLIAAISGSWQYNFSDWRQMGIGLEQGNSAAADFIKKENIKGPIFNDYDIGGYLIFHLYPQEKVFVDNRPEAYGADFFKNTYIPMQNDEKKWKQVEEKYKLNAIVFSVTDVGEGAQGFLIKRIADPGWAPVFTDGQIIIFLKRIDLNKQIIQKYEIPKSNFGIK
ncbi:MAG: hypothetical protein PHP03_01045 [Candidatus Pacebacteria bacterium]|nr:hypothetical protein [Candidatus Paceibacterota bacterium]